MTDERSELSREEVQAQYGAALPDKEAMSLLDVNEAVKDLEWALSRGARMIGMRPGPQGGKSPADPVFGFVRSAVRQRLAPALAGERPVLGVDDVRPALADRSGRIETGEFVPTAVEIVVPAVGPGRPNQLRQALRQNAERVVILVRRHPDPRVPSVLVPPRHFANMP